MKDCKVCNSELRDEVDDRLRNLMSLRGLARMYPSLKRVQIKLHARECLRAEEVSHEQQAV